MNLDDLTPADPPSAALRRLAEHQRELCEVFDRVAPRIDALRGRERADILGMLARLCAEGEHAFADAGQAVTALAELEAVFNPRKDRP